MENKTLNSQESIELIQRMITASHDKFQRGGGTMMLIAGYTTLFFTILVTVLSRLTDWPYVHNLWWGIPIVISTAAIFIFRSESRRTSQVRTFVDRSIGYVWITVGSIAVLYPLVGEFSPVVNFMIIPTEALLIGIGTILTGLFIRLRPIVLGGIAALAAGFAMFFFDEWYIYLFMAMCIFAIIIPGHILNYKGKCSNR